jgi:3-methyladenine DNA glycosylase AlkD
VNAGQVIAELRSKTNPKNIEGMARFGITAKNSLGISMVELRAMAKSLGKSHDLALTIWDSGIHEARILASLVDEPEAVTDAQMERWVTGFDSWDVCDQVCMNLFWKTARAYDAAIAWTDRDEEFVRRAGFALMAVLAWHDKDAPDKRFERFFPFIKKQATDERNFVKKAVNWALRQIGKRNVALNKKAIVVAREIQKQKASSARWIASDALRELTRGTIR